MFVLLIHLFLAMELWENNVFYFTSNFQIFDTIYFLCSSFKSLLFSGMIQDCLLLNVIYFVYSVS